MSQQVETECRVKVYEIDGTEATAVCTEQPVVIIRTHWNRSNMVVLEIDGKTLTVLASSLKEAINRCSKP